uniref:Uncharacterized protein n=1 Tax=Ascaris lumbricoides TaxID=6252 RepID=A0A0M3IQ39_ASCLU
MESPLFGCIFSDLLIRIQKEELMSWPIGTNSLRWCTYRKTQ